MSSKYLARGSFLEVLGPGPTRKRNNGNVRSTLLVRCACGVEKIIIADTLSSIKSCGCKWMELHKLPENQAAVNHYFASYLDGARKRRLSFQLTHEDFLNLVTSNCYYCGAEPEQNIPAAKRYNGTRLVNGIDRVDNTKGYIKENCVSCCRKCNSKKGACTLDIAKKMLEFK